MVELIKTPRTYENENAYHLDPTWSREEDEEHIHKTDLPFLLWCSSAMFYLCFIFMETPSWKVENGYHTPIADQSVPSLLFTILPCLLLKASSGKSEQNLAGTWPVCPITELQARRKVPLTKFLAFEIQSGKEAWPSALNSINGVCPYCSVPRACESWTTWNRNKLSNAAWAMTALGSLPAQ